MVLFLCSGVLLCTMWDCFCDVDSLSQVCGTLWLTRPLTWGVFGVVIISHSRSHSSRRMTFNQLREQVQRAEKL